MKKLSVSPAILSLFLNSTPVDTLATQAQLLVRSCHFHGSGNTRYLFKKEGSLTIKNVIWFCGLFLGYTGNATVFVVQD